MWGTATCQYDCSKGVKGGTCARDKVCEAAQEADQPYGVSNGSCWWLKIEGQNLNCAGFKKKVEKKKIV